MYQHPRNAFLWVLVSLSAFATFAVPVRADSSSDGGEWTFTAGAKLWENSWASWIVVPTPFNHASREVIETINSDTKLGVIPQLSMRYGNWLATASSLLPINYTLTPSWGTPLAASRYEVDVNAGYYVLPGLALTVGYKQLEQKFGGTFKWRGPTLGFTGAGGLGHNFSIYGTVGVGVMKAYLPFPDGAGDSTLNATYLLGEAGIAYSFSNLGRWIRSFSITLGYRSQTLNTKNYALADTNTVPPLISRQDVRDTTQGATLSVIGVF